ncbi:MAG: hypothetical protein F6J93_13070 [Oscillatoria sp. SIO1A7]|nr:hypothetical protein [Oscillatoria sp. SIO1A7]
MEIPKVSLHPTPYTPHPKIGVCVDRIWYDFRHLRSKETLLERPDKYAQSS